MKKYENYKNNLHVLEKADHEDLSNDFIVSGIIDKFMLQFELAWKLMKELLMFEGSRDAATGSPRQIIKTAYQYYSFIDPDVWLQMLAERNRTAHMYDEQAAVQLTEKIIHTYIPVFQQFRKDLEKRYGEKLESL
jgi:nucleotidyltransferase substrate binding protein (TIGR01987 family)